MSEVWLVTVVGVGVMALGWGFLGIKKRSQEIVALTLILMSMGGLAFGIGFLIILWNLLGGV